MFGNNRQIKIRESKLNFRHVDLGISRISYIWGEILLKNSFEKLQQFGSSKEVKIRKSWIKMVTQIIPNFNLPHKKRPTSNYP